jgi:hypothetical protein
MHGLRLALSLSSVAALLTACGDDNATTLAPTTDATTTSPTSVTTPDTTGSDPSTTLPTTGGTTEVGSATDVVTSTTEALTSTDPSTTGTDPSTTTTDPSTTTTDASTGTSVGETQEPCLCAPGSPGGCEGDQQLVCADDCQSFDPVPCPNGQSCVGDACSAAFCLPGKKVCDSPDAYKQCNGEGSDYDPPVACAATEGCFDGNCVNLCLQAEAEPSTIGCSFIAARVDNIYGNEIDSLVVGNTSKTKVAQVQLYFTPNGGNVEQAQGAAQNVQPGQTVTFQMTNPPLDKVSGLRKGGNYRVQSTIPVIAYQHSPITGQATNDASVLFPEHALRENHYVSSWKDGHNNYPSYFNVIAVQDNTTVKWTPSQNTLAGNGVPAVNAGQTGQVVMNRFDTLQARAPFGGDLTGTFVTADKPIWVLGAAECINIPTVNVLYCDHIQEQMLALDYWGKKYVGAHSPKRGSEKHYYRIFGGEDGVQVTTTPAQPGTPFMLDKGQWKELVIQNGVSFLIEATGPILPVQYLESQSGGGGTGDPAMYQMIPVEQFLDAYAFVTGTGYDVHYAQITRLAGNPDVVIDGQVVNGYYAVGEYEVADFVISEGAHFAQSDAPFGIVSVGYTDATSYAYPGGLRLAVINPQ